MPTLRAEEQQPAGNIKCTYTNSHVLELLLLPIQTYGAHLEQIVVHKQGVLERHRVTTLQASATQHAAL